MGLNAQARIYGRGILNLSDGLGYFNIAQGAVESLGSITQRIMELAEGAANGSVTAQQRVTMQAESNQLVAEFNRILETTNFGDRRIYQGGAMNIHLQGGTGTNGGISLGIGSGLERNIGGGTYTAGNTYSFGFGSNRSGELADLNGDGKLDMITSNNSPASGIAVRLGNGDGTFGAITTTVLIEGAVVKAGDFNGDGKVDIVAVRSGSNPSYVLYGNGDGSFQSPTTVLSGNSDLYSTNTVEIGDLNGDGVDDVAFGTNTGVTMLLGSRSGPMTSQLITTGLRTYTVSLGDINGDGRLDLVTGSDENTQDVVAYRNNGNGTFSETQRLNWAGAGGAHLLDRDGDGRLELVTNAAQLGTPVEYSLSSTGQFTQSRVLTQLAGLGILDVRDLDGDGLRDDFVTGLYGAYGFYFSDQHGNIAQRGSLTVPSNGTLAFGDVNGDGVEDLLGTTGSNYSQIYTQDKTTTLSAQYFDLSTARNARSALDALRTQFGRITSELSQIGSAQSRLGTAIAAYRGLMLETEAARDRIESADIAQESAIAIRSRILKNAATAVLAQANQSPELVLQLLR
jgi:flagellin-like hook-associated protein FlgL